MLHTDWTHVVPVHVCDHKLDMHDVLTSHPDSVYHMTLSLHLLWKELLINLKICLMESNVHSQCRRGKKAREPLIYSVEKG